MKTTTLIATLSLAALLSAPLILSGCATQGTAPNRHIAAAGEGILVDFMDALSRDSSANRSDFEKAFFEAVNKDSDGMSVSKIHSIDDIRAMSADDQAQIMKNLAADPALKDALGLSSDDAAKVARQEAVASQDARQVVTSGVSDLRAGISKDAITAEDAEIRRITGVSVLGDHASSISDPEAQRNLKTVLDKTHQDVIDGKVHNQADIEKDVDRNIADTEDTNDGIAKNRRCRLAQPVNDKGCGVLSQAMYDGCDE